MTTPPPSTSSTAPADQTQPAYVLTVRMGVETAPNTYEDRYTVTDPEAGDDPIAQWVQPVGDGYLFDNALAEQGWTLLRWIKHVAGDEHRGPVARLSAPAADTEQRLRCVHGRAPRPDVAGDPAAECATDRWARWGLYGHDGALLGTYRCAVKIANIAAKQNAAARAPITEPMLTWGRAEPAHQGQQQQAAPTTSLTDLVLASLVLGALDAFAAGRTGSTVADVELHPAIVTKHAPQTMRDLTEGPWLRVVRADQVKAGDLMVGAFWRAGNPLATVDYFGSPYPADPAPFDPACNCGVCGEQPYPAAGGVTLSAGYPWDACDPFAVNDLVLILPATTIRADLFPPRAGAVWPPVDSSLSFEAAARRYVAQRRIAAASADPRSPARRIR